MSKEIKPHILIVDDDRQIRTMLARFLAEHAMRVTQAGDGEQMFKALETGRFDVIVLDVMMPGDDGFTLCRKLRSSNTIPLILLTARNSETDRIVGLELGADDYVTKPFDLRELLARVRSVLRRTTAAPAPSTMSSGYAFPGFRLDLDRRRLTDANGTEVPLTSGEFDLLCVLVRHPNRVLSRDAIMDEMHGRTSGPFDRAIDVQIGRLRRKIEADSSNPQLIKSVRNAGYLFAARVDRA